ncbi:hypothetical protein DL239_10180 [Sedimentitalea sp. CY04]|uniref:RING-type E3 ubiquitin transferase n=1 Tax=Parasedimentitalea denitrificans TaxID=2211118 RepID=A0ABX0W7C4_9RHOB|nr:hypothetical protein [Sedimentitalea sp. CY04]NIZ61341.1 hypothetical protein [Sedimentitalea sp. CY04]
MSLNISLARAIGYRAARIAPYVAIFLALNWFYFWLGPTADLALLPTVLIALGLVPLAVAIRDLRLERIMMRSDGTGKEGAVCAVHGQAVPLVELDHEILACHFRILSTEAGMETTRDEARKRSREDNKSLRYEGVFQVPTQIITTSGAIDLNGFPNLTDAMPQKIAPGILENAKAQSRPAPGTIPTFLVNEMLINRPTNQIEMSLKYGEDPKERFRRVEAWMLKTGQTIWAIGRLRNNRLVPVPFLAMGLPVYFGTRKDVRAKLRSARPFFFGASAFFMIMALITGAIVLLWA